jgi:hypothetical protein
MIVMLACPITLGHLVASYKIAGNVRESKLALVEVHTYNPAHRKEHLGLVDVTGWALVFRLSHERRLMLLASRVFGLGYTRVRTPSVFPTIQGAISK